MIDFSDVKNSVQELKKQLAADQIDEKKFESRLLELIDVAEDGYYWMYGHESESWYRHDGKKWEPADPSRLLDRRSQVKSPPIQPNSATQRSDLEDFPINVGWFIISLLIIVAIGWIVYSTSPIY